MAGVAESGGRLQIDAELRNLQARRHVTGLKWNMTRKVPARASQQAFDVVEGMDSGVCSQATMEVVSRKDVHGKENGHCSTTAAAFASRSGHIVPSNGLLACSFMSFKGGIPRFQGKTFSFGGQTFTRDEGSPEKSVGTVTCMTTVSSTKSFGYESIGAERMDAEHLAHGISRAQSGLAFGCISRFTADTELSTRKTFEEATTINRERTVSPEIEGHADESLVIQDSTWRGKSRRVVSFPDREATTLSNASDEDQTLSSPRELKEVSRSRESKANGSVCEEQEGCCSAVLGKSADGEGCDPAKTIERRPNEITESVKAVVEDVKCISGCTHIAPNPKNRLCGGCCEGTVFTFTSAASNGRLRQRLRYRTTILKPHGRKEEATDSVFSEMRMMPLSRETLSADGQLLCSAEDLMSTPSNGKDFIFQRSQGPAQNPLDQEQLECRVGREKSGEFCNLAEEDNSENNTATCDSTSVIDEFSHILTSEYAPGGRDENAERKILAGSESFALHEAGDSDVRISDVGVEAANLCHKDLQQESLFCEVHDTQAMEPETLGNVRKDNCFREDGISSVTDQRDNEFSPSVDLVALCPHKAVKVWESTPVNSSKEDVSALCSGFGSAQLSPRFEGFSENFSDQKTYPDIEQHLNNPVDHNVGRKYGGPKRSGPGHKSRCELSSERKKRSPVRSDSAVPANALAEDLPCPVTLDISGEAATLTLLNNVESREKDPYTASRKDVPTSSQESLNPEKCQDLPPEILKSEYALSSSLRHSPLPTNCKEGLLSPGEKRSEGATVLRQDNKLTNSSSRSGFEGFSQHPGSEESSDGGLTIIQSTINHLGSKPRSPPLGEQDTFDVSEMLEAPERYDDEGLTGQHEGMEEAAIFEAQSVPPSQRHDESNSIDRGKVKELTNSISHGTTCILEKHLDGWEREETQWVSESSTYPADNQKKYDFITSGTYVPSETSWTMQSNEHKDSYVRAGQEPGRAGLWWRQDQDFHCNGPTGEKGNANMEGTTDSAQLPVVQGCWDCHSYPLEWNGTHKRETQASSPSLDQLGTRTSSSHNRFTDPIPWNEAQRSSTAPIRTTAVNRLRPNTCEVVQPRQSWNHPSSTDFQARNHGVRKDEGQRSSLPDGFTQDEVFLERFSTINDSQKNRMQHRRKSSVDFFLSVSGSPTVSAATSARLENRSFSPHDKVVRGRQKSPSFTREVEPPVPRTSKSHFASLCAEPPAPHGNQMIYPSPSNVGSFQQPLPYDVERSIPRSNKIPNQPYDTYEAGLLPDVSHSFSSVSPCTSSNGYSGNTSVPDSISFNPELCWHGSKGYAPGVAWRRYSDENLDLKAFQPMPVQLPPSLVQNPTFTLNSQTIRSSCHTAQPFCDPCNYNSCSISSCYNQFPVCGPMLPQPQYICGSEHTLGHHLPAYISARPTETACTQHIRVPVSQGYVRQYAPEVGRYAPPQTMATRHSPWPASDKKIASSMCGDKGVPDCNSALGKEQDSGLIWLTGEEMNLIRELRQSVGKDSTRSSGCLADPEPTPSTDTAVREGSFYAGGSNVSHASSMSRCSNYSSCTSPRQIHEAGPTTHMKAANIIQRAWRALLRRREKAPSIKPLPKNMKDFYELIKARQSSKNYRAPSFDHFVRSIKYIQARTEGARVRRRLKSRRLQAIIMEIKEIRNLLSEMSEEGNRDASAPYLYPQLCNQLHQKILQFHTALTGPQMQARFLLQRGPATPLVIYPSKSPPTSALNATASHKLRDQQHSMISTAFLEAKALQTCMQSVTAKRQGSRGKVRKSAVKFDASLTDPPESAKLLPWYFLAQRSPSKPITGRSSPTEFTSCSHESKVIKKKSDETVLDSSTSQIVNKGIIPYQHVPLKKHTAESSIKEIYEEQPMSLMQRRKTSDLSFDEIPIGTANVGMFTVDLGPTVDLSNRPKRPFLKRKSIVMAPQKLDWSKVKPMVSSRLEPELKTKLSYCRHTKAVDRPAVTSTSRRKKENYNQVKSRLFSYEGNISPSSSKGNGSRAGYSEQDDTETPRSRGGSFLEEISESGEGYRLADYRRPASPDLLRLKSQMQAEAEAELAYHRVQTSGGQIEPTYSSRFDSARYLHKLENSELAAKGSSMQAAHPRTQRIRLRLVPGSEENEPGRVLVQKIENQEEEIPDLWHDQRIALTNRRRQSHSHRYASYRESSQGDAQQSSNLDDSPRPSSPPDRKTLKASASSKMGLASKELEEMFERVIAAKCVLLEARPSFLTTEPPGET